MTTKVSWHCSKKRKHLRIPYVACRAWKEAQTLRALADGSSYQPRAIIGRQGQNMWPVGEVGGESIWTWCKQKGKVSCLDTGMIEGQNLTKGQVSLNLLDFLG